MKKKTEKKSAKKSLIDKQKLTELDIATRIIEKAVAEIEKKFDKRIDFLGGFTDGNKLRIRQTGKTCSNVAWISMVIQGRATEIIQPKSSQSSLIQLLGQ